MSAIHPDEATLLRWAAGELPERRQAALKRHVARCRSCRAGRESTRRLHERLSAAGDALAFAPGDPFAERPIPRDPAARPREAAKVMAGALARLEREKAALTAAIEEDASKAGKAWDLGDAARRLAAAHLLEEALGVSSSTKAAFARAIAARLAAAGASGVAGESEITKAVLPTARLLALAHLVAANRLLFEGKPEVAEGELAGAWHALADADAPEHLAAWAEVAESLRRSYLGRPVEGRLLAERALGTFERYGLAPGVLKARHARAVALYYGASYREAHREFRAALGTRDATGLDRARAVSGAAFCLVARGRFVEAAKEYSIVRRRLRGDSAVVEQYLLRVDMKLALGTAGRWSAGLTGRPVFALPEAGGAPSAKEIAAEIVKLASEEGIEAARLRIKVAEADPVRFYALLYVVQLAMPKVSGDPAMYVELA